MKEYDIFIPLYYNDGTEVEAAKLQKLREELLELFGGLTFFPQSNLGLCKSAGVVYRDEIVIFRVISSKVRTARRYLTRPKEELKKSLKQEEILIVERDISTL